MKILLTTLNAKYIHINLAIRLLYQLNKAHEGLRWKEFTIKEDQDEVAKYCAQFDVVAFSCYIWNITQTLEVASKIKAINPNTQVLLGGPEVSYEWLDVMSHPAVDFIITGEGEIPFTEFVKSYPKVNQVPNLVRKEQDQIIYNPQNISFEVIHYKDIRPYQDDEVSDIKSKVAYIETSRGCPYKCEFCLASLDNKVRYLPDVHIKETLLYLMQHGKVVKFLDRTFNMKRDFTIDMFEFILAHHRPGNVFQFEITADILHPDIIRFINEKVPKGLFRFEIGIQTVNQKANLEVSRKQNFEKTKAIIKQIEDKVELHLDLIVGLAYDYFEDIKYSIEEVFKLYPPELQLGFLKFLKGTPVREKHAEHGFVFDPKPPYQIISSNFLNASQLEHIVVVENALEIYWNKGRSLNSLRYVAERYSIFDFFHGLGSLFLSKRPFHQYKLNDVYQTLFEYVEGAFPEDEILKELVTLDYYLQHKTKPKMLFLAELERKEKSEIVDALKLNHHKFRHVMLPIHFDFEQFITTAVIDTTPNIIILEYNGTSRPSTMSHRPVPITSALTVVEL